MPQFQLPTRPARMCAIISLVTLSGCATTIHSAVPTDKVTCAAIQPVYWSKNDTDKTIAQIKEHNAAWASICKKPSPAKPAKPVGTTFNDRWFEGFKVQATAFR